MKKKFKLQDLDCANCAAKMEDAIKKIDGVNRTCMCKGRAGLQDPDEIAL